MSRPRRPSPPPRRWFRLAWLDRLPALAAWFARRRPRADARAGADGRPFLEALDDRIAPGDAVGGYLAVSPFLHQIGPFGSLLDLIGIPAGRLPSLSAVVAESPRPTATGPDLTSQPWTVAIGGGEPVGATSGNSTLVAPPADWPFTTASSGSADPLQSVLADDVFANGVWNPFGSPATPAAPAGGVGVTPPGGFGGGPAGPAASPNPVAPAPVRSGGGGGSPGTPDDSSDLARLAGMSSGTSPGTGTSAGNAGNSTPPIGTLSFHPAASGQGNGDGDGDGGGDGGGSNGGGNNGGGQQKQNTSVALSQSVNSSVAGQSVIFTATVSATGGGGPTDGTVTFKDGTTTIGTETLDGSSTTAFTTNHLSVGTHTLTATYGGDTNYNASSPGNSVTQVVSHATSSFDVQFSPDPAVYGEPLTIQCGVDPEWPSTDTPTGQVTVLDGGTVMATLSLNSLGETTYTTPTDPAPGMHEYEVEYGGDGDFNSNTDTFPEDIQVPTTTTVSVQPAPSVYGQAIQVTAVVQQEPGFDVSGTPTGTIQFTAGGVSLGSATLNDGTATLTTSKLIPSGDQAVYATYSGDTDFSGSMGSANQSIYPDSSTTTLTVPSGSYVYGQTFNVTATVAANSPGGGTPTGQVVVYAAGGVVGVGTLNGSGVATVAITGLVPVASPQLTAYYLGDGNFYASTGYGAATVVPDNTSTVVTTKSGGPSVYSQPVTFTATVTANSPGSGTPTQSVYFYDGSTFLGAGTLSGGVATFTTAGLALGSHSIRAAYGGDPNFNSSNSPAVSWSVIPDNTQSVVNSSVSPSVWGQTVTFTASVTAASPGIGTPTGLVDFLDGTTVIGQGTLSGGRAATTATYLAVGSHTITVAYLGDPNFNTSTSPAITQVVNQDSTNTSVTVTPNPSTYGQSLTLTATVTAASPGSGLPTGTVVFSAGNLELGTATLDGTGTATTVALAAPPAGSPTITASYHGDSNFLASAGNTTASVSKADTSVSLSSTVDGSAGPSVYGQFVTLTATVSVNSPGGGVPTGSVVFTCGSQTLDTGTLNNGVATITTKALPTGDDTVTATYTGDPNFNGNYGATQQTVNQDSTTTTITLNTNQTPDVVLGSFGPIDPVSAGGPGGGVLGPDSIIVGPPVQVTATVTANAPGSGTPTGTVTFYNLDGTSKTFVASGNLSDGSVTFTDTQFPFQGRIEADYAGDTNFLPSTGYTAAPAVDPTTTALTASPDPVAQGQPVTFTATVSPTEGVTVTPTGSVSFYDGSTLLQTVTLTDGVATLETSSLSPGSHSIQAQYSGDGPGGSFSASSNQTSLVVQATTGTTLDVTPMVSVFGQTVTLTATVTSSAGTPDGSVSFYDGSTLLDSAALSNGTATYTTSTLALGSHTLQATYSGSTDFGASNSSTSTATVNPDPVAVNFSASTASTTYGQAVLLVATVSSAVGTPPDAVLSIYSGQDYVTSIQLTSGTGETSLSSLLPGVYALTASYPATGNFAAQSSNSVPLTVNPDATTVAVTPSANPSVWGQPVTFTATVTASTQASGTPGGTVTFYDGSTVLGTGTLQGGSATYTTSTLSAGLHSITASYAGDTGHTGGTSPVLTQDVQVPTSVAISATVSGQGVNLRASVYDANNQPLSGIVTFKDNGTALGPATLSNGLASYSLSSLPTGLNSFTVYFGGDSYSQPNQSDPASVAMTNLSLSFSANPSVYGQAVTLSAALTSPGGNPQGTVYLSEDDEELASAPVVNGTATFQPTGLTVGSHSYTVAYYGVTNPGATSFAGSYDFQTLTVNKAATTVSITPSDPTPVYGQPVTLVAGVSVDAPGAGNPTGPVSFYDNSDFLGTAPLVAGFATFVTTTPLAGGPHAVSATFADTDTFTGNSGYNAVNVLPAVTAAPVSTLEGTPFQYTAATLAGLVAGQSYPVQIDWGDGTPPDTFTYTATDTTGTLTGSHLYRTAPPGGAYLVTVTVTDPYTSLPVWSQALASVTDLPWGITGVSPFVLVARGAYPATGPVATAAVQQPFTGVLGYLTDLNPYWLPSDYAVTVSYGDTSPAVTVVPTQIYDPDIAPGPIGVIQADHVYTSAGTFHISVTVSDLGTGTSQTLTNTVTILTRPFPVNQFAYTTQDTPASFNLQAVEPDGDPVTYTLFSQPADGTVNLSSDGTVVYTPAAGFTGEDEFYFQAADGPLLSNLGLVRVVVTAPPPTSGGTPPADPPPDEPPSVALADSLWVVHAGETPTLSAAAGDVLGPSDITDVEWDFNYDGSNFVPDPTASGTLTPAHEFDTPGIYLVAVQVTNSAGQSAIDTGSVEVLAPSDPGTDDATPEDSPGPGSASPPASGSPGTGNPAFNPAVQASNTTVNVGDSVVLTASAGAGIAAGDQTISWDYNYDGTNFNPQGSGPAVAHTFAAPGVYTVAADISDGEGDEQVVTVMIAVNDVPTLVLVPPADLEVDEGQAILFPAPQAVDLVGNPDPATIQWDFNYDGTFVAEPSQSGNPTPQYQYPPGDYVVAVQESDDAGHTATAFFNVQVDALPPDVSAGGDLTVNAGQPVTFQGSADAYSGIATVDWDFNYDGQNFVPDPAGAGTLTPTYTYDDPGTYSVALEVYANNGLSNLDVITVTVNDVAPAGSVAVSSTNPDGSTQAAPVAGSPVYFAVSGMNYTDPSITPSIWADWDGTGNFSLVTPDQWQDVSTSAGGESLMFAYTYDAPGTYQPAFRVEDAEGDYTESDLTVTVADAAPSGTFGWGDPVHTIAGTDTVSFTNVTDPSQTETDAGFTYYYQIDGGGFQASDSPDYTVEGLAPGSTHTLQAYIRDAAGTDSPVYTQQVQVQGDVDLENGGSGTVQVDWTGQDGASGSATLSPGQTYTFADEPATVNVTLLTSGASYDLSTNGSIDSVDGSGVSGVTLEVHTDDSDGLPDPVGDGHIGPITVGANSTVTVGSRGDFGGLSGTGAGVVAQSLEFDNLDGPISGVQHIDLLQADGNVSGVTVADGIDNLEADSLANITFETDPAGPATPANVVVGPGGFQGNLNFGNQAATQIQLDFNDDVTSITDPGGNLTTLTYNADGSPATLTDAQGTYTFSYGAGPNASLLPLGGLSGIAGAGGGLLLHPDAWYSWFTEPVSAAASAAAGYVADTAQAVGQTIQNAFVTITVAGQQIAAKVADTIQAGVSQVTYYVNQAGQSFLALGDVVVSATKDLAESFAQNLQKFGKSFTDLWNQLQVFQGAATQVLQAIVNDPAGFFSNLAAGVGTGITNFLNGLSTTLPQQLMQWLTAGLSSVPLPTSFDTAGLSSWLLSFFKLDWNGVQQVLVNTLGAGNVALITQAYTYLSKWIGEGAGGLFNWVQEAASTLTPAQLVQQALQAGVNYLVQNLVPKAVSFIVAKFAVPVAGIVSGIYDTVSWLFNSLGQVQQLAGLATQVVQQIGAVVAGQTQALAQSVTGFLNGLIPVGINFLAGQLHLSDLPQAVAGAIESIRSAPLNAIQAGIALVANKAKQLLGLNTHPEYQGLISQPVVFQVGGVEHRLWVVNQDGHAVVMRASDPGPLNLSTDLPAGLSAAQLTRVQTDDATVLQLANQAIQAAGASGQNGLPQPNQQAAALQQAQATLRDDLVQDGAVCFENACFAAGTPLLTPYGDRPIEAFRVGDELLSRAEGNPEADVEVKVVEEVFVREGLLRELGVGDRVIRTTAEHPFWVRGKGWLPARDILAGDELYGHDGRWTAVTANVDTGRWARVYNLRVADYHTYFVGGLDWEFSVWAHNASCAEPATASEIAQLDLPNWLNRIENRKAYMAQEQQLTGDAYTEFMDPNLDPGCFAVYGLDAEFGLAHEGALPRQPSAFLSLGKYQIPFIYHAEGKALAKLLTKYNGNLTQNSVFIICDKVPCGGPTSGCQRALQILADELNISIVQYFPQAGTYYKITFSPQGQ